MSSLPAGSQQSVRMHKDKSTLLSVDAAEASLLRQIVEAQLAQLYPISPADVGWF